MKRGNPFFLALGFLTVFPVGSFAVREGDLIRASFFFPLVGFLLGLGSLLGRWLLLHFTQDPFFSGFLTVFLLVFLTRGLHLDGVADVCDAWVVAGERRKAVLKDSRIGTFGVLGVVFVLGAKVFLLAGVRNPWYVVLAPFLGRVGVLELAALFSPLNPEQGLGKELLGRVPFRFFLFWVSVGGVLVGWGRDPGHLLKIGILFGIIYTLGKMLERGFGGLNGDMLGLGIEVGEMLTLCWGRFWP